MKPSKNVSVSHAKRKLSTTSVEGAYVHATNATRRTRSSSNAGNIYTQRSTRSTQNNAFFELPHSYGSRKQQNGMLWSTNCFGFFNLKCKTAVSAFYVVQLQSCRMHTINFLMTLTS